MSSNQEENGLWWTCAFICPITGRIFKSGTIVDSLNHQILRIPEMNDPCKIYIGNLPSDLSQDDIKNELSRLLVGGMEDIENIRISDGSAWVKFRDATKANDALNSLNGKKLMNERMYATRDERIYYKTSEDALDA